jgi:hypothetical protein
MGAVTTWFDLTDTVAIVAFLVPRGRPADNPSCGGR